jgi:hypothetical protein
VGLHFRDLMSPPILKVAANLPPKLRHRLVSLRHSNPLARRLLNLLGRTMRSKEVLIQKASRVG